MHRQSLLQLLDRYQQRYPAEQPVIDRIRRLVTTHSDCFERSCRPGHITGAAWIVSEDRRRCLLVHHRKLNRWLQPGGHADGDPVAARVALREAQEESGLSRLKLWDVEAMARGADAGERPCEAPWADRAAWDITPLDVDVHVIPARYDVDGTLLEDSHEHHDIRFLVVAGGDETPRVSAESYAARWFSRDELARFTDEESVLRLDRKVPPAE
jgi:8-oxo-dGTP pyrophosphatase MutT (NUDIX family)